jgi:indolepyruvate ferredoxin oxidoreductase alpha subunit
MSVARQQMLLQDTPGARACLLGNLAIVRGALEAGVQFFSCYPGTPSSEVGDTFARLGKDADVLFEYSVNEKIAVEVAFAACLTGARAMCGMKHLGLSYANDPLSTMPYVGVEGGLVLVSAGDPSAITSPNEQDQRHFSEFLYYPVFDPATPADALRMTRYAFEFSEATRLPVILRPTTRVCHSSGMVELGPMPTRKNEIRFAKNPPRHVPIPDNARRMRTELTARYRHAAELLQASEFYPRRGHGRYGIIAGGVAYAYAAQVIDDLELESQVTLQQVGAYPIPAGVLTEFVQSVDAVLVVEELTPLIEQQVSLAAFRSRRSIPVLGKLSGHFPLEFEYSPDLVEDAARDYLKLSPRVLRARAQASGPDTPALPPRPPVLCPGCPHRTSFYMVSRVFGKHTVYCGDIGCYTLGYGPPLHACDVLLCMGSSITQASGIARLTRRRTVAYIGDSTFFHSGLPALLNAVQARDEITVVILDNYVTAMTGFQPSPTTPDRIAIEPAVRGLGVDQVFSADPFDEATALAALRQAQRGTGVNVVVFHAPCVVNQHRVSRGRRRTPFVIDQELCNACSRCVRVLGCPGIRVVAGGYSIDSDLCDGCALCARLCRPHAIKPAVVEKQA